MNKLEQFQQMLQQHDWAYVMSDDHSRFMAGVASTEKLRAFANGDPNDDLHLGKKKSSLLHETSTGHDAPHPEQR